MKVARVLQILALLLLLGYLALLGYANPQTVRLPFLVWLPTAWVVAAALLLGFAAGWLSLSRRVFRLGRENRGLRQRLIKAGLEVEPASPEGQTAGATRRPKIRSEPPRL